MFKNFCFKGLLAVLLFSTALNSGGFNVPQDPNTTPAILDLGSQPNTTQEAKQPDSTNWFQEVVKSFEAAKTKNKLNESLELPESIQNNMFIVFAMYTLITSLINVSIRKVLGHHPNFISHQQFFVPLLAILLIKNFPLIIPYMTGSTKTKAKEAFYSEFSSALTKILEPLKDMEMLEAAQIPQCSKRVAPVAIHDVRWAMLQNLVASLSKYAPEVRSEILRSAVFAKTVAGILSQPQHSVLHNPSRPDEVGQAPEVAPAPVVLDPAPEVAPAPVVLDPAPEVAQKKSPEVPAVDLVPETGTNAA